MVKPIKVDVSRIQRGLFRQPKPRPKRARMELWVMSAFQPEAFVLIGFTDHLKDLIQANKNNYASNEHHNLKIMATKRQRFIDTPGNDNLDINTKIAAVKASPFVVSLVSFSGEVVLSQGSGTIIEAEENNNIVLTSLNLIRRPTKAEIVENSLADNLKIVVRSSDENSYIGEVYTYDFHYNLLIIKFRSNASLQSAYLRMIDDDPGLDKSFVLRPHSLKVKPGDPVVVVGRHFYKSLDFMAAPGRFSMDRCEPSWYDCRELLSASCSITMCGDGGPLINLSGEVIGIAYYEIGITSPFLPINIAFKWWDHYKRYKEVRHPSYGFEASNLYAAIVHTLEKFIKRFPSISSGVLVETVLPGSYAERAGLREDDVITKCDGKTVSSFLELWDLMWDKVGDVVELEVARVDLCSIQSISMEVGEATPDELNKWPRFDYR